jgi:hypothetical protein
MCLHPASVFVVEYSRVAKLPSGREEHISVDVRLSSASEDTYGFSDPSVAPVVSLYNRHPDYADVRTQQFRLAAGAGLEKTQAFVEAIVSAYEKPTTLVERRVALLTHGQTPEALAMHQVAAEYGAERVDDELAPFRAEWTQARAQAHAQATGG